MNTLKVNHLTHLAVNQLEEKMLQLETDLNDYNMIDQVFRIMHTLKGNSGMISPKPRMLTKATPRYWA